MDRVEPAEAAEPAQPPGSSPRRQVVVALLVLVVLGIGAMWFYAFFLASSSSPDKLPDQAWTERAEAVCAATDAELDALAPARSFADIEPRSEALRQRADVAEQATALLRSMVVELRAVEPADDRSRTGADLWLADWDRYLAARDTHVEVWRRGVDQRFVEPPTEEGETTPVSLRMDAFAKVNRMPSCQVPGDIG